MSWLTEQDMRILMCDANNLSDLTGYFIKRITNEVEGRWIDRREHLENFVDRLTMQPSPAAMVASRYFKLLLKHHRPDLLKHEQ